jgi:hypothetical protein
LDRGASPPVRASHREPGRLSRRKRRPHRPLHAARTVRPLRPAPRRPAWLPAGLRTRTRGCALRSSQSAPAPARPIPGPVKGSPSAPRRSVRSAGLSRGFTSPMGCTGSGPSPRGGVIGAETSRIGTAEGGSSERPLPQGPGRATRIAAVRRLPRHGGGRAPSLIRTSKNGPGTAPSAAGGIVVGGAGNFDVFGYYGVAFFLELLGKNVGQGLEADAHHTQ